MSVTFTKLFASITESTVWCEPDATRLCWITMLAMADSKGRVWGSIPGLANRARISVDAARTAINTFLSPDPDSRTKEDDGRRIEMIDGGWRLINHEKYRSLRDQESIKEAKRKYINERRKREKEAHNRSNDVDGEIYSRSPENSVDRCRHNAEAEAENTESKSKPLSDKSDDAIKVLEYLNSVTKSRFRPVKANLKLIAGCLKDASFDECISVIDRKNSEWKGEMREYLRPSTLFNQTKFHAYLGGSTDSFNVSEYANESSC